MLHRKIEPSENNLHPSKLKIFDKKVFELACGESGSISVMTIGLFLLTVALIGLISDIGSIAVAKRSLIQVTESAVLRASHILNERAYYEDGADPGVPIDCSSARIEIANELEEWMRSGSDERRPEITKIWVTNFQCSGSYIEASTSAMTRIPFALPQSSITEVEIRAHVAAESERNP